MRESCCKNESGTRSTQTREIAIRFRLGKFRGTSGIFRINIQYPIYSLMTLHREKDISEEDKREGGGRARERKNLYQYKPLAGLVLYLMQSL